MKILFISFLAWFVAQLIKVITYFVLNKKLNLRLFFASGGMPSAHSAFVVSIAMQLGFRNGFNSDIFILALALSMIVVYDAMNVRRSVGLQGVALNQMIEYIQDESDSKEIKTLKVVLGHTPSQVFFGILLGVIHVYIFNFFGF